jgi:DNA-binding response OmpR family regulator
MDGNAEHTRRRLLLADDSVTIRKVVELTFAEEGIEVISASDGDMAMQKFVEHAPDIVLVDVEMPGSSGYQICEMIKADESTRHIPVLLLVGSFEPFDQTLAEQAQADGFLTKPFHSIRELVARVNELLGEEIEQPAATPETHDIDHLYSSSFTSTETQDSDEIEEDLTKSSFEAGSDEEEIGFGEHLTEAEYEDDLGDSSLDDEMVETIRPELERSEIGHTTISSAPTIEARIEDFDWSPAGVVKTEEVPNDLPTFDPDADRNEPEPEPAEADTAIHDSRADTVEMASPFAAGSDGRPGNDIPVSTNEPEVQPTDEVIELIAKRVMDRLSDRVVRDIARDAVPRIAEKLIREALEEESKN